MKDKALGLALVGMTYMGAAGGAIPVAGVLIVAGVVSLDMRWRDLLVSDILWWRGAEFMFTLAAVAIILALVRAVIVFRERAEPRVSIRGERGRVPWPRAETSALILLGLAYGAIVAFILIGYDPCGGMLSGSERTTCAMGWSAAYVILVFGGLVVWIVGSVFFALVWIVRTAMDVLTRYRGGSKAAQPWRRARTLVVGRTQQP